MIRERRKRQLTGALARDVWAWLACWFVGLLCWVGRYNYALGSNETDVFGAYEGFTDAVFHPSLPAQPLCVARRARRSGVRSDQAQVTTRPHA